MSENSIALVIAENPVLALTDKEKFAEFLKDIKAEIDAHVPDVSTPKGRAEIGSLAYKVTRSKTAIDKAGKELNAVKRKEIDAVDAERREIWARLEALADEVRKPLTEWEEAEEKRKEIMASDLMRVNALALIDIDTSAEIAKCLEQLTAFEPMAEIHQDEFAAILEARQSGIDKLQAALDAALQREKDAAELAELRAEKERRDLAEKERLEREAQEKSEREEAARVEKEQREAAELAEQTRQKDIADAADKAREAEQEKARLEQVERDRVSREQIDKANREAEELRQKEEARLANERAEKAAQDTRDRDRKHRGEIMKAAKEAIMSVSGADEETAKKIVLAIVAGEVPNTKVTF